MLVSKIADIPQMVDGHQIAAMRGKITKIGDHTIRPSDFGNDTWSSQNIIVAGISPDTGTAKLSLTNHNKIDKSAVGAVIVLQATKDGKGILKGIQISDSVKGDKTFRNIKVQKMAELSFEGGEPVPTPVQQTVPVAAAPVQQTMPAVAPAPQVAQLPPRPNSSLTGKQLLYKKVNLYAACLKGAHYVCIAYQKRQKEFPLHEAMFFHDVKDIATTLFISSERDGLTSIMENQFMPVTEDNEPEPEEPTE